MRTKENDDRKEEQLQMRSFEIMRSLVMSISIIAMCVLDTPSSGTCVTADLNRDGVVDFEDFFMFADAFGTQCHDLDVQMRSLLRAGDLSLDGLDDIAATLVDTLTRTEYVATNAPVEVSIGSVYHGGGWNDLEYFQNSIRISMISVSEYQYVDQDRYTSAANRLSLELRRASEEGGGGLTLAVSLVERDSGLTRVAMQF